MKTRILLAMRLVVIFSFCKGQDESPVEYMNKVSKQLNDINLKYMSYISASSHGSVRKADRKRQLMLEQLDKSRSAVNDLPSYKGDKDFQQAALAYMKLMT